MSESFIQNQLRETAFALAVVHRKTPTIVLYSAWSCLYRSTSASMTAILLEENIVSYYICANQHISNPFNCLRVDSFS